MGERLSAAPYELDRDQVDILRGIGQQALAISEENYCSGFPHFRGGKIRKLGHNNARHNFIVGRDSAQVGGAIGFDSTSREALQTAGHAHDVVQLKGRGMDERESAEWVVEQLRNRGFPETISKLTGAAIMGTLPIFNSNGEIVDQAANQMDFDSRYEEAFVKTVATADLGEIHTPMGPYSGHQVYKQLRGLEPDQPLPMDGLMEFQESQLRLVTGHRYLIPEGESVLATHRTQVIKYSEYIAEQLREGKIESGDRVTALDMAFMRNPDMQLK